MPIGERLRAVEHLRLAGGEVAALSPRWLEPALKVGLLPSGLEEPRVVVVFVEPRPVRDFLLVLDVRWPRGIPPSYPTRQGADVIEPVGEWPAM